MNPDAASLENLRDITELDPVSWWPLAIGWWALMLSIGVVSLAALVRAWRTYRKNAYRRSALRALESAADVVAVADILKRTALCVYPRNEIASLSDSAWFRWLEQTSGVRVTDTVAKALSDGVFARETSNSIDQAKAFASDWIHHHVIPSRTRNHTKTSTNTSTETGTA